MVLPYDFDILRPSVPGMRFAVDASMGLSTYPYRRFLPWSILGGTLWSVYTCALAYYVATSLSGYPLASLIISSLITAGALALVRKARAKAPAADDLSLLEAQLLDDAGRQVDRAERGASLGGNRRRQRKVEGDVPLAGGKQRREGGRVGHIGAAIGGRSQKGIDGRARGIQRRKCALHDVAPPLIAPVVLPRAEQPHLAGGLGGEQLAEGRKKKSGCQIA